MNTVLLIGGIIVGLFLVKQILRWAQLLPVSLGYWRSYGPDWSVYRRITNDEPIGEIVGGARGFRARVNGVGEIGYPDTAYEAMKLVEEYISARRL